ncbi:MAG: methyltransferase domain-containing protein [Candidatus Buchananbacteria bacterium]|nr:methyltransferase domain-containing protein [Candidatus Buchananbacteria bacterium]
MVTKEDLDRIHNAVPVDYYERGIKKNLLQRYWHHRRFKIITKEIKKLRLTGTILDLGCHSGDLTNVVQAASGCPVIGVDISGSAIEYAKSRFPHIQFVRADFPADKLFSDDYFIAATCFDVMEHLPDTKAVLAEVKRLLKPGGYFIIAIPNENWLFKIVWWFWLKWKGQVWEDVHVHDFKKEGFGIFLDAGFKQVTSKKIIFNMWHFIIFQAD